MSKTVLLTALAASLATIAFVPSAPLSAQSQRAAPRDSEQAQSQRQGLFNRRNPRTAPDPDVIFSYGSDPLQSIGFYHGERTSRAEPAPLILFVHGGGWKRGDMENATGPYKSGHYNEAGYHFASINYRLVPEATVEQQAQDVASALKALLEGSTPLGIDTSRVVLMGHSAGAHLVALVSTDPQYLRGVGLSLDSVLGTIPLDGAAYDVPQQMATGPRIMRNTYRNAFGTDQARQRALSPTLHAAAPNVANFLIPYVEREDGAAQSRQLAAALQRGGSSARHQQFEGRGLRGHAEMNMEMGNPDYPATLVVDDWLEQLFAR